MPTLDVVEVRAGAEELIGTASAATEGTVTAEQLATRPLLRPAETLEIVPGVIITQHSGDGKANQYFLRGFNLDHGTDFFTTVNGVPVNFPTHAHGQGYSDLNFLIPELVERVRYKKGPYSVEEGDFAAAGAAHIEYFRRLPASFAEVGVGENGYRRGLLAGSPSVGAGNLLYALEWQENDGPWTVPENYGRLNAALRYSQGVWDNGFALTAMAYRGQWTATDQVARRALDSGLLDRYGSLDPSSGGKTQRYSLAGEWARRDAAGFSRANAYLIDYQLNLFSNFTYFLSDPVNGDQFEQADKRTVFGAGGAHTWYGKWAGRETDNTIGIVARRDRIRPVGLYLTSQRQRLTTIREDRVTQSSVGLYVQNQTQWAEKFRAVAGWRHDFYRFDVGADRAENSGKRNDHIGGPKLALIFGPWASTELYANYGRGFHSNDARGATIHVNPDPRDPGFLGPVDSVSPLVRAKGYEVGLRSAPLPGLQTTLALWGLDLDSELLFVGDAGTTEASRPSRRVGVEWANFYRPLGWLTIDADISLSRARFRDDDPAGNRIPGAIERVVSVGMGIDGLGPWFGGIRLRHFGPRPLIEDNSVRSASSTTVNLRAGYRLQGNWQVTLDVLNLFDRKVSDIDYFYASCLRQEVAGAGVVPECDAGAADRPGVSDIHTHPAEPRTVRVNFRTTF
jgi:outer membrane receptor protein involved in Fe transport